jgi:hypothetical protein
MAALDMNTDTLYGHVKANKKRTTFLVFCRYLRSLYAPDVRIGHRPLGLGPPIDQPT